MDEPIRLAGRFLVFEPPGKVIDAIGHTLPVGAVKVAVFSPGLEPAADHRLCTPGAAI